MLVIFHLCLLFGVFGCAFSHWMCDSAQKPCDGLTVKSEYLREGVTGWFGDSSEMKETVSESIFAIVCQTRNCGAFICSEDSVCILGTQTELPTDSAFSTRFFSMENYTNVARDKETFYSTAYANTNTGDLAVDGGLTGTESLFASKNTDLDPWFVVDLASKYLIKCIRILGRQDGSYSTLKDSTIYGGNDLVQNGDFSSYTPLATMTRSAPSMASWFVATPTVKEMYRFLAIKRDISQGFLHFVEIEIYA